MDSLIFRYFKSFAGQIVYLDREGFVIDGGVRSGSVACEPWDPRGAGSPGQKSGIVVLGKSHYYETVKTYPIASLRDIREAVELEAEDICPFSFGRVYLRHFKQGEGRSLVQIWFIKQESLDLVEPFKPYFVVPETALMAYADARAEVEGAGGPGGERADGRGMIFSIPKGDWSLLCFVSARGVSVSYETREKDPGNAKAHFRQMVGHEAATASEVDVSFPSPYLGSLHRWLARLGPRDLFQFLHHNPFFLSEGDRKTLKRWAACAGALVPRYGLTYSVFLANTGQRLEEEHGRLGKANAELTVMEEQLREKKKVYQEIAMKVRGAPSMVGLFTILNEKLPQGALLNFLRVTGSDVEIRGTAPKATEVLTVLNGVPGVEGPRFVASVQKAQEVEGHETFVIGFRIR